MGHVTPYVLLLVQCDQAGTDIVEVRPLPVKLLGLSGNVVIEVLQELAEKDLMCLKANAAAVAEPEVDRGPSARGLSRHGIELAPGTQDLVEPIRLPALILVAEGIPASLQE